ncbi:putative uncharacterized protein C5orf58 homolog isoform X1 [Tupaia chinensis]|uniref:putative uncharacterized protein C5orf58 homolog isoform X1 n=1 Tax=Tupaia chinensis TaxID=246437 RepID=UPI0007040BC8|nr:putative uncharacterized protein C5orf58 homolog isoform X1 [Tupaia chinensis]XP_014443247.1 putative uncharacterized protein C5orf58 homolog isoform X1 [Tupaia chinensis]XP_014443248.1 putative uncharacterized protein C5orf58 homolog isoform X1 [Tupaia chinensis]XP_027627625.1 putative uncharacterized protein C5orf58 homolog isoform X1 [Tupaia chinensis]
MFNSVAEHKQNVEAIIKNINTISLELKKMKDLHRMPMTAAVAKGHGTAEASLDQSGLPAGAGERSTSNGIKCHQEEEGSGC